MREQFVEKSQIQYVIEGINKLYDHMIKNARIDAAEMKVFLEPYFTEAGYRDELNSSKAKNKSKSKSNIVILHDAGVGDFILMSAVIREIRRTYPKAYISLMINRFAKDMAEFCPYVDEVIPSKDSVLIKSDDFFNFYKTISDIVKPLLRRKIDVIFNFGHYPSSQLLAYMSGAKERVDLNYIGNAVQEIKAGNIPGSIFADLSTFHFDWRDFKGSHYNERFLYILHKYSKTQVSNKALELWINPVDKFEAKEKLQSISDKKIYAIVPGGNIKLACKRWSAENYSKLMNIILDEESVAFIILGGIEDVENAKFIKSTVKTENILDFTNKLNYRQSAAILNLCDCYIGNDTGLMHAAAALNIPILTPNCFPSDKNMNVSSLPALYYPYNVPSVTVQPKQSLDECKTSNSSVGCSKNEPHCINQISPATMFEGLALLNKRIAKGEREPLFFN